MITWTEPKLQADCPAYLQLGQAVASRGERLAESVHANRGRQSRDDPGSGSEDS